MDGIIAIEFMQRKGDELMVIVKRGRLGTEKRGRV